LFVNITCLGPNILEIFSLMVGLPLLDTTVVLFLQ